MALGATISQRITDLIGSEYATIPSLSYKDLIVAAFNEVADMVSVDILLKYSPVAAQQLAADVANGYNVEDKKILLVLRRDGDSLDRACSALTLPEYNAAKDTGSIYQATKFSPVYTIDSNNATGPLRILPDCTDTEKGFIYYFNYATNSTDLTGIDSAELHSMYKGDFKTCKIKQWETFNVLKYDKNNFFKPHVDHGSDHPRTISLIYLLNNDYEGGDLIFFDQTKNNEEYVVEKKANRAIIFPSNFIFKHTVTPVKKGTRFSIVGWGL